ncbi:MAG TPA: glycosyltransferase family 4 protein [Rhizomicrobium sp.]|nr:glycosyltransferase family 4 protein [Rhizomicrobium sp.]
MANRQTHLLHVFPTFAVGGSQMRFAQLARIHGPRYRHTVLALDQNYDMAGRLGGLPIAYQELTFDKRKTLQSWRTFRALLHSLQPDVLLTYNWGAVEWALLNRFGARTRHVHIEDGFGPEEVRQQLLRRIWTRRLALSGAHTRVILPSRNLEKIALSQWSLPPNRVLFVPNGVDCARFAVASRAARNASPLVIGTVASLRREKNIARLIRAFAVLAAQTAPGAVQLVIVGEGAERPALEQLARALAVFDHVRFTGQTNRPEEWYPQMDIFALSSDTEQMPLSVLEAMAAGLPVVATAVGDVAQMVSARNAPYIAAAQDQAFGNALARLAADRPAQRAIGAENEKKAREDFDEQVMARRYAEIIG